MSSRKGTRKRELSHRKAFKKLSKSHSSPWENFSEREREDYLEELQNRYKEGKELSDSEKELLCSNLLPEYQDRYSDLCFEVNYFNLFLDYSYYMAKQLDVPESILQKLDKHYQNWKPQIEAGNPPELVLKHVAKETRDEIKKIKKNLTEIGKSEREIDNAVKYEVLKSKFFYQKAKKILRRYPNHELSINFNKSEILVDAYSIIHALSRHYGKDMKNYKAEKSYFSPDINLDDIPKTLKDILEKIQRARIFDSGYPEKLYFRYKRRLYMVWISESTESRPGLGNTSIIRVKSFYPVDRTDEYKNCEALPAHKIDKELVVYSDTL